MTIKDFSVGQKVYLLVRSTSNLGRHIRGYENKELPIDAYIQEAVVTEVGRKYLTVVIDRLGSKVKFDSTVHFQQVTEYTADYIGVYLTKQEIYNRKHAKQVLSEIKRIVNEYDEHILNILTLEELQAVRNILSRYK